MTSALTPFVGLSGLIAPVKSTAKSEPATRIEKMLEEIRRHLLASYVMRSGFEQALDELDQVRNEASIQGWNGYGALPMNPSAYDFAKTFLNALPTTAPVPEVSADPDGEVSLDWIFGNRQALSVSIGPTGRCTFAWTRGPRTYRGTDWIDDEIPASIVFALGQLARDYFAKAG